MKSVRAILRKEFPITRRVVVSIDDADEAEDLARAGWKATPSESACGKAANMAKWRTP